MWFSDFRYITLRKVLILIGITLGAVFFAAYVLFQARFLIEGPTITLSGPSEVVQKERVIELAGHTENIVRISLNDRQIYTDENGYFNETVVLENGYTIVTLKAEDRYGRKTELSRSFIYKEEVTSE